MIDDIFEWKSWDSIDEFLIQLYEPILKVDIPGYSSGTKFNLVTLNFQNGRMDVYVEESSTPTRSYKLSLGIL